MWLDLDAINEFQKRVTTQLRNKAVRLDFSSHMTSLHQSEWFIAELSCFSTLKKLWQQLVKLRNPSKNRKINIFWQKICFQTKIDLQSDWSKKSTLRKRCLGQNNGGGMGEGKNSGRNFGVNNVEGRTSLICLVKKYFFNLLPM